MDCFIKKIFEDKIDNMVHLHFQKFSRGTFSQRAIFKASVGPKGYSIATSNEYANDFVRLLSHKLGNNKSKVTGAIISTANLKDKIRYSSLKQFMGIKQYVIDSEMSGTEMLKLIDELPEAFFALSFTMPDGSILKIKPKAPKSAKPSTSEKGPKPDFCSLKTNDKSLIGAFIWEQGWKKIEGQHDFVINDIEIPKNVADPNEMRRLAKRKGKIVRKLTIDEKAHISEKDFVA